MGWQDERSKVHYTQMGDFPADSPLYREWQTYKRELPRLLAEGAEGKFALIKGDEIIGIFGDEREAERIGRERYLMQPFMAQPIREWEPFHFNYSMRICPTSPSS
jgi:hypothetical protein